MSRMPRIAAGSRLRGLATVVFFALLQAAAAGAAAIATREVFSAFPVAGAAVPVGGLWTIAVSGCAIALFRWLGGIAAERLGHDYVAALRLRLFRHIARMPAGEHARRRVGGLSLRFVGDLSAVRLWVSQGLSRLIAALIVIPLIIVVLYFIQPAFAWLVGLPVGIVLVAMAMAGGSLLERHRRLRNLRASLASDVAERLPFAPQLRLLGRLDTESAMLARRSRSLADAGVARQRRAMLLRVFPDVAGGVASTLVLLKCVLASLPAADAAAALAGLGLMLQPLRDLATCWDRYCAWHTARQRCEALFAERRLPSRPAPAQQQEAAAAIRVVQRRGGKEHVFEVAPGELVVLTGEPGSGKSTLLRQIAGIERTRRGSVRIDGVRAVECAGTRGVRIALVGRDAPIISGSLRRVLTLGAVKRPADSEVVEVANAFGLGAVLSRSGGLDQRIADAGRDLSSGERRRILLVRAILSRPRLLLLDEPEQDLVPEARHLLGLLLERLNGATIIAATGESLLRQRADKHWSIRGRGRITLAGARDVPNVAKLA